MASRGRTQDSPTFSASAPPVVATLVSSLICNRGIFSPRPRFPCPIRRPLCMVARLAGLGSGRAAKTVLEQHLDPLPVLGMIIDAGCLFPLNSSGCRLLRPRALVTQAG